MLTSLADAARELLVTDTSVLSVALEEEPDTNMDTCASLPDAAPESMLEEDVLFLKDPPLRPCCSLGHDLRVSLDGTVASVKIDNVVNPRHLGNHSYRFQMVGNEQNGLIYTCRGGIIDLAHVRDNADRTAYLFVRIKQALGSSFLIPLYEEGGQRDILLRAAPELVSLSESDRKELALRLAMRISFEMSVWHEIVSLGPAIIGLIFSGNESSGEITQAVDIA
jgi:hypothetical protein